MPKGIVNCGKACSSPTFKILSGSEYVQIGDWSTGSFVDDPMCITTGAPSYGSYEHAQIKVLIAGTISAKGTFGVEFEWDFLKIGIDEFSGTTGPFEVRVIEGTIITWTTDPSVTSSGWTVCLTPSGP